jgi:hypothetical protein
MPVVTPRLLFILLVALKLILKLILSQRRFLYITSAWEKCYSIDCYRLLVLSINGR